MASNIELMNGLAPRYITNATFSCFLRHAEDILQFWVYKTKANNNQLKPGFLGINEVTRGSSMQFQECFELNRLLKQKSVCIEQGHPETGFSQIT